MSENFDLVVIGGGPGGYVAAIRAAQLGMKVACVEKRGALGGTCLNVGCIPSKALLNASHHYETVTHLADIGIDVKGASLNLPQMMKHKDKIVSDLTKGIEFLFKKNKVTYVKGFGKILAAGKVAVLDEAGKVAQEIQTKNILIATGSDVASLPSLAIDEEVIVSSTGALSLKAVPEHLVVIGGGVIGLEMASVWGRLGAKITVIEFLDRICPTLDGEVGKDFQKTLEKQGMTFRLSTKVTAAKKSKKGVELTLEPAAGGAAESLSADVVLVSIGRKPFTEGLGLSDIGVTLDNRGRVQVDKHFQTNIAGIYAIGDVIEGPMLAHKAEDEGMVAVEMMAGQKPHINYDCIPSIIYTHPEVAAVGKTEEELKTAGVAYKSGKFPFLANSRARANSDTAGFVKILADAKTDRVLGAHLSGPDAGTLIAEIVAVMEFGGSAEDIARTCHAHPTLNEAVKEAALAVDARAVHV